ncbi:MAG: uracil-DNA glycosylase, partial [Kangiellaceae bacterium]|nr:uracil-DNA glycosylase [Kangiellaceae bacterium]
MTNWTDLLAAEKKQKYFADTLSYIAQKRAAGVTIYPTQERVFSAFSATPFEQVKVVILGQDPYHGPNQAHGLCFSVLPDVKTPPSLVNIYKELQSDLGISPAQHGYLMHWAQQGVLLLNSVLTVERCLAASHQNKGWDCFKDASITQI